jgi:hypothetical protein
MNAAFKLSVVTITKDDPSGLDRTLKSLASWRRRSWVEHIVIHAGVTPVGLPANVIAKSQMGIGLYGAMNEGLRCARGEWVWFVNGGDAAHEAMEPEWLLKLLRHTLADIVVGGLHWDEQPLPARHLHSSGAALLRSCWLPHPATLLRRQLLLAHGGFGETWLICGDYDLWCRLFRAGAIADVISLPFARFASGGISESKKTASICARENRLVVWRHGAYFFRYLAIYVFNFLRLWLRAALARLLRR